MIACDPVLFKCYARFALFKAYLGKLYNNIFHFIITQQCIHYTIYIYVYGDLHKGGDVRWRAFGAEPGYSRGLFRS